jgi:hypothetical protein
MKRVEHRRWRYRDVRTVPIRRTTFRLTAEEAAGHPDAERVKGSMLLHEAEDDGALEAHGPQVADDTRRLLAGRSVG